MFVMDKEINELKTTTKWISFSFLMLILIIILLCGFIAIQIHINHIYSVTKNGLKITIIQEKPNEKILQDIYAYNKISKEDLKQNELMLFKVKYTNQTKDATSLSSFDYYLMCAKKQGNIYHIKPKDKEILLPLFTGYIVIKHFVMLEAWKSFESFIPFWVPKGSYPLQLRITDYYTDNSYVFDFLKHPTD